VAAAREDGALSALVEAPSPAQAGVEASAGPAVTAPDGLPQAPLPQDQQPQAQAAASVFVCISCRRPRAVGETGGDPNVPHVEPGRAFAAALAGALAGEANIAVVPVECLAVCRRPCTVAFVAPEKWTYIVGDVEGEAHVAEIATAARAYAASETGILRWADRPPAFKKGVVARVPPTAYRPERAPT
jgi:predicted metal-binding protein